MAEPQFTVDTGVVGLLLRPAQSWQPCANENTNGPRRQYFPKGADLSGVSQGQLDAVAAALNGRPLQTLNWMTPSDVLAPALRMTVETA